MAVLKGHNKAVYSVVFGSDSKTLASGSYDKTVKLWNVENGILINTFIGHTKPVLSLAFIPNTHTLVSGSADATIRIWNF
ncbi:hypothetical protein MMC39_10685 [Anabaena sp. CCAP 1446/1C]|uniref:WD40 repeat domain-containing protein n=1 Tax=Anabaena sp. PCC 7938 TaxID=1296340 RepID=UPI000302EE9F|nr:MULTISPECIES: hypothetical protein [Anabaena]MBY5308825.1 hypothetical protein [Anabaena sp. CCAP 1446/1C]MCM2406485.1 hypothetical protein [Anabaena sp. CCAP 1446/1C]BAY04659.1 WD-repeat protein [Anabaena cylindrica PCC 7122]